MLYGRVGGFVVLAAILLAMYYFASFVITYF